MHPQPQRSGHRRRHSSRRNSHVGLLVLAVAVILCLVAGLFYFMTSGNFAKPR